jgi:hypothetical protein
MKVRFVPKHQLSEQLRRLQTLPALLLKFYSFLAERPQSQDECATFLTS